MTGEQGRGTPPPEVPDEFAAAYWAAYEEALRAQSVPPRVGEHAQRPAPPKVSRDELPVRTQPIRVGTHRADEDDDEPSVLERVTDSVWFVPALLLVLALLLLVGAYVLGRMFAAHVGN